MNGSRSPRTDLLVVGGGPTGLTAALAAALAGMRVTVLEPHTGVIDKACGEGLMPAAVDALAKLGVSPAGQPFVGIRYLTPAHQAQAPLPAPGLGVRRTELHARLLEAVTAAGVRVLAHRARQIRATAAGVDVDGHRADALIAADGLRSPTRHALGLDAPTRRAPRYGLRAHVDQPPWTDHVEVYWADDAEAYVTPVSPSEVGVAFLFGDPARHATRTSGDPPFDRLLRRFPALGARLTAPPGSPRGAGPFAAGSTQRVLHRALLVGDAAGYLDPITGEGLKLGILGAVAAVDAIASGRPARWERAWRRLYLPYAAATGSLLGLAQNPWTRRWIVPVAARAPGLMRGALKVIAA